MRPRAPVRSALLVAALLVPACGGDAPDGADEPEPAADTARPAPRDSGEAASSASPAGGGSTGADSAARPTDPLYRPGSEAANRRAPDVYRVEFTTTEGSFTVEVRREWAPRGADRLYNLARLGFYEGARFFRVIDGFVAQFGLSGRPRLDRLWRRHPIPDDPVRHGNVRGTVSFASAGEDTRTTQIFVNLRDNTQLDSLGFAPVGEVVEGMEVVDRLYAGYGEGAPRGAGPAQSRIVREGNAYLEEEFPKLDYVEATRVREGAASGG